LIERDDGLIDRDRIGGYKLDDEALRFLGGRTDFETDHARTGIACIGRRWWRIGRVNS
jgi:hypothetical protein